MSEMNFMKFLRDWWHMIIGFIAVLTVATLYCTASKADALLMSDNKVAAVINAALHTDMQPISCKQQYRNMGGKVSTRMQISESTLTITFSQRYKIAFADHTPYMDYLLGIADNREAFAVRFDDGAVLLIPTGCGDPIILSE
jgi:hypothetical protein